MNTQSFMKAFFLILGKIVLFPLLTILVLAEPLIRFLCSFLMLGGIAVAIAFEISAVGPNVPFLIVLGMSIGFGILMLAYQALIALLLRD
jgi:hypothetical protein